MPESRRHPAFDFVARAMSAREVCRLPARSAIRQLPDCRWVTWHIHLEEKKALPLPGRRARVFVSPAAPWLLTTASSRPIQQRLWQPGVWRGDLQFGRGGDDHGLPVPFVLCGWRLLSRVRRGALPGEWQRGDRRLCLRQYRPGFPLLAGHGHCGVVDSEEWLMVKNG